MALKKATQVQAESANQTAEAVAEADTTTTTKVTKTAPAFEAEPDTGNDTAAVEQTPARDTEADRDASAKVAASTAIAKASTTAIATADAAARAKEFQREVTAMRGASDFSYGNYRLFKASNGSINESGGDQEDLGRWAQVRLLSWDDHTEVSPGEEGASTKDFVAYSKDGKVIDSVIGEELKHWVGKSVEEYLDYLRKEEEFPKAKSRRFIDTAVALLATDSGEGPIGTVIQVSLSESSIPAFQRYQQALQDNARCAAMGLPGFQIPQDPFNFFYIREAASKGNQKWTKLRISQNLPAKV